jgi:tetratricopeptide (TPR) repeat protein
VFLIIYPLNFLSGDLNPYSFHKPTFHYYLLGLTYLVHYATTVISGSSWDLSRYAAHHYFWDGESLLIWARAVGVLFAIATVWSISRLARAVYGARAGLIAALFLAVSVLHVRQSPLAAVDIPLTFWFVCAMWSAARLCRHERAIDYVLTGALVGLAAGTKYPGAAAGVAVLSAHLLSGRRPWDQRLWISALVAVISFLATTPYALLDFKTFVTHLLFQAQHAESGRGAATSAWFHHLWSSLPHSIGVLGLAALPVALALQAFVQRKSEAWVMVAGFLGFLLVVGWGQLAFMRYALPLAALQIVLVSGALASIRATRWCVLLVALIAVEPLYGSARVAHLLGSTDTRSQAASWIENNIAPGSTCCNFGGWAGDPPVRTFSDHWWRMTSYERSFGRQWMDRQIPFLIGSKPKKPFYWYAVHAGNREFSSGDLNAVMELGCAYVILHRHPLSYSTVDSSFAAQLPRYGDLVARWTPVGLKSAAPVFDPADAYYLPLGKFGPLRQAGPEIEIWKIEQLAPASMGDQTAASIFSKGYALWTKRQLEDGEIADALALVQRATELATNEADTRAARALIMATAAVLHESKRHQDAVGIYREVIGKWPDWHEAYDALGLIYCETGEYAEALAAYGRSLNLNPDSARSHHNMALAHDALGHREQAIVHWERTLELDPNYPEVHSNLAKAYARENQVGAVKPQPNARSEAR